MEKIEKNRFTWVGSDPEKREGIARPSVTYWQDALGRLRRNPVAMVCLGIILLLILSCVLYVAVYASMFTMIQMLTGSRAMAVVLCILLALGLYVCSEAIFNVFYEPAMWDYLYNPNYPGDAMRGFLEVLYEFLPTGQGFLLTKYTQAAYLPIQNIPYALLPCYSGMLIALTTGAGLLSFQKKRIS